MGNAIKPVIGEIINLALSPFGLEMRRKYPSKHQRNSIPGALTQIKNSCNFSPRTIVDVGAAFGGWSRLCYRFFPDAQYFLFEPLREFAGVLKKYSDEFENVTYFKSAAGSQKGNMVINVHEDLVGSSLLEEADGSFSDGQPREISVITLDEALSGSSGPYLVKVDVQGAELEVLRGAEKILKDTEYIILEVSLFQSIINAPLLFDVISFMKGKGFVAYDIISFLYRPLDQALSQVDMAFVKENGQFRKDHRYCTREQRREQNRKFREKLQRLIA